MTAEDAAALQREFAVTFPPDYLKIVSGQVARELDAEALVVCPQSLRESNAELRREDQWGFRWEDRFWWIGCDGAGGFYFIDTGEDSADVYYCDHEDAPADISDRERLFPTDIGNHVSDLVELQAEMDKFNEKMDAKVAARRWWQFWLPKTWPPKPKRDD